MISDHLRNNVLANLDTAFLDVYSDDVDAAGLGTSVLNALNGSSNRIPVTFKATTDGDSGRRKRTNNSVDITANAATGVSVKSYAIWSAQTGGVLLFYISKPTALSVSSGFGFQINEDEISVEI